MDRRNFLKVTGTLVAASSLAGGTETATAGPAAAGRPILPLNRGWRYSAKRIDGAHARDFDDSGFERVVVPHTNISLPWRGSMRKSTSSCLSIGDDSRFPDSSEGSTSLLTSKE